ncbi:hypothetical protein E1193_13355 [Micromonospora sp. KC606]|uniref:hypothetical protein n=1 Tax=Micromonospora sp. KC606 TaxID=2530379 RepID=UPI001048B001|nr:hypothetical protein [Micromonospora sp. KC606]TDC81885.1 hypothetical protein E1193_13355 [Micromonospora sp. KC606]
MFIDKVMQAVEDCCATDAPEPTFDPTATPGAHEWFARVLRDQETPPRPLAWPDRPDVYWCAGLAGGCDAYHRVDFPFHDVTADEMPLRVCAPTVSARTKP